MLRILFLNLSLLHFVFIFEDEVVREFNPGGDGRMRRCAASRVRQRWRWIEVRSL